MKRVLLFLLLFGTGLAILLLLQETREVDPEVVPVEDLREPDPGPSDPGIVTPLPDQGGQATITSSGPIEHKQLHPVTGKKLYQLLAEDHHPVPGGIDLYGVTVRYYDEETGELETELSATEAQVLAKLTENGVEIEENEPSTFQEVEISVLRGVPLAPLRASAPEVQLRLGDRTLTSESDVLVEGRGLRATGRGLVVEEQASSFRLLENPRVHLRLEDGTRGELTSAGPISVAASEEGGLRGVSIEARDKARLDLRVDEPGAIEADVIVLGGETSEAEGEDEGTFTPRRGSALGSVVLTLHGGEFFGDRAELEFDAAGRPTAATLEENLRVLLDLGQVEAEDLPPGVAVEGDRIPLEASGAGPLRLEAGEPATFRFGGPVEVRLPTLDATLEASESLTGARYERSGFASLVASGDAVARYGDVTMMAEEIDLGSFIDRAGTRVASLSATSSTRTSGTLSDGRAFVLETTEGIVVERSSDFLRVPRAGGVDLRVEGEHGFTAQADEVRDLDVDALTFVAEGNVRFEGEPGVGSGHRLEVMDPERMELVGDTDRSARFEIPEGTLEGGTISRDGDVLEVSSQVRVDVSVGDQRYELSSRWARIDRSGTIEAEADRGLVVLDAGGDVRARVTDSGGWSAATRSLFLRVRAIEVTAEDGTTGLEPVGLAATGEARFSIDGEFHLEGEGEHLEIGADGTGMLLPSAGERTLVGGELPRDDVEFTASGGRIDFSLDRLEIQDPVIDAVGFGVPLGPGGESKPGQVVRIVAGRMVSDRRSVLLTDGAYVGRFAEGEQDWALDAEKVLLSGGPAEPVEGGAGQEVTVDELLAWGGFTARFGSDLTATGEEVHVLRGAEELRMSGAPAMLLSPRVAWEADWFDVNLSTGFLRAGKGQVRSAGGGDAWSLTYASVETVELPDTTIQVIREPTAVSEGSELRAAWALFWVDSREWARTRASALGLQEPLDTPVAVIPPRPAPHPQSIFGRIAEAGVDRWLQEVYLEGNIEYRKNGERTARADAVYFDLIDGHGWMREFDLLVDIPFIDRPERMKLSARWMHHAADGSFRADQAVATLCEFEEPHYVIRIGNLNIEPKTKEVVRPREDPKPGEDDYETAGVADGWNLTADKSEVELFGRMSMPVPALKLPVTEDLNVDTSKLSLGPLRPFTFGNDTRLGNFVGTTFTRDLGGIARGLHKLIAGNRAEFYEVEGQTDLRVSWNGDRGLLGGFTSEMKSPGLYNLEISADGLFDSGEDRGLIRVDPDDRSTWRHWIRARGRYLLGETEWLDLVLTTQADASVQSEFFEGEFLKYEYDETYAHWRRAEEVNYFSGTLEARLDAFRTDVIEQPSFGHFRARTKVADITDDVPLQYTARTSLGYLKRREGNSNYPSPFAEYDTPFRDGFGETETLRADTEHRLETPFELGQSGLRATPFVEGRATGWLQDAETSPALGTSAEDPARLVLSGGLEIATTFWRAFGGGNYHVLSPFVGYREAFVDEGPSDPLVFYDRTELPQSGRYFDLGVRTRWSNAKSGDTLDVEIIDTYAADVSPGVPDRWLPLRVHGSYLTEVLGMDLGAYHDARYDFERDETPYSRTLVGLKPSEVIEVETGYHSARDQTGSPLYDALSIGARYTFSPKWEIEGRYTHSSLGDGRLASDFAIRRFGHDFVFAFRTRFTLGEGGTSFLFDVLPLIAYKARNPGLVSRWRESGL